MTSFNERIIAEFRANGGSLTTGGFGRNIILVHHVGVEDGVERVSPLYAQSAPEGWTIVAANSGSDENPKWYPDLVANSGIDVEYPGDERVERTAVRVSEVPDAEWEAEWAAFLDRAPGFAEYQSKTDRRLPILRLTRSS